MLRPLEFARVWWGNGIPRHNGQPGTGPRIGLKEWLAAPESEPTWAEAVSRYRAARKHVDDLTGRQVAVADACDRIPALRVRLLDLERERRELSEGLTVLRSAEHGFRRRYDAVCERLARLDTDLDRHREEKPGLWAAVLTLGRVRKEWHVERDRLNVRRRGLRDEQDSLEKDVEQSHESVQRTAGRLEDVQQDRDACRSALVRDEGELARSGLSAPNPSADEDEFEASAPWADRQLDTARSRLFLAALALHKAFLPAAAPKLHNMLVTASRVLGGDPSIPRAVARAAWQAFFLVVPVVSTTFASLPRLFRGLGPDDLGWLLVDEAGQATPQSVVGGLARCRRAVIIGDPMQLEPIVPLPKPAQRALGRYYRVDEQWLPYRRSAQAAADRLNRYGTAGQPDDPTAADPTSTWVGAPLRVHRRCDRPMFDICNSIAYTHAPMVFGVPGRRDRFVKDSMWFDVRGRAQGNVVDAELDQLEVVVRTLLREKVNAAQIRVITPFTDVRRDAKGRVPKGVEVGTLHSVQGTEADVVVLVLGGGSAKARQWAAETPNMLNVAVSRARRCLCVIGDHQSWSGLPYFAKAAQALPVRHVGSA